MLSVRIRRSLPGFSLDVEWEAAHEVVALFGASGSGKSLTLQCLAGLTRPDEGRITVGDRTLFDSSARIDTHARDRRVGYLFQGYALFPHLTVEENIAFGLHRRPRATRRARTAELIEALNLSGTERAKPGSLSGGQQQRVALGRALAADPDLLLLDEPLSALDTPLRHQLRLELANTVRRFARTTVLVTHDVGEAFQLADRIVVYDRGRVVQAAPKIGWQGHSICAVNPHARPYSVTVGARVAFFIRAEDIRLVRKDRPAGEHTRHMNFLTGTVVNRIDMGTSYSLLFAAAPVESSGPPPELLEIDVPKTVFELLQIASEPRWQVVIQPGAVQLLPS